MISSFRTLFNSFLIKVILSVTILLFILTSIGTYIVGNNKRDYLVQVNGEKITNAELDQALSDAIEHQQQSLGNNFQKMLQNEIYMRQLRQQSLVYLIDKSLLRSYVNNLNLSISDNQLKEVIFNQNYFQVKGVFDNKQYNNVLNKIGLTANQYVTLLRKELSVQHLITTIVNSDFVLPNEINKLADLISQKRSIRKAIINIHSLAKKQTTNDDEISQYYQQYKNNFLIPEKFRISYIKLNANKIKQSISESDINKWYQNHKSEYYIKPLNRYRIIQTKTKTDAKKVLDQLNKGISFSKLARNMSIDPISSSKGGDIGWIDITNIPNEIKNSRLKKKGQISDIISTSKGFIIVYLEDIMPGRIKSLSEVHNIIIKKIRKKNITNLFSELNQKVSSAVLHNNNSLKDAEIVSGVKKIKTGWFNINNIPKDLDFNVIKETLYSGKLSVGNNSDVIKLDDIHSIVVHMDNHKKETIKPIKKVQSQIINMLKMDKARQQAKLQADKIMKAKDKQKALASIGILLSKNTIISRSDDIQNPINQMAFSLQGPYKKGEFSWGVTEDLQGNLVIVMLNKVIPYHMPKDRLNALFSIMIKNNSQMILKMLLDNLSKSSSIKYRHKII
ncbi:peptidylprolyl isomerase [Pantoea sp. SoEX]|uniref:peptidylprolyl isomerase n=1 Tax=Pantoea sp. SoEX TaxID=2576763 RepID=UPI00135B9896|nr:peptidylprolyl isomerase [Pantoea sp. SoEX]MXP51362.1 peptidylprolyl isomerase [Pantoea sp. SoEX]